MERYCDSSYGSEPLEPRQTRQMRCSTCHGFDPELSQAETERFVVERNDGIFGITIKSTLTQLRESARSSNCRGCALLQASLFHFFSDSNPAQPLSLSLVYNQTGINNAWTSDLCGSILFGLDISLKTQFEGGKVGENENFEFFSIEDDKPPWKARAPHALPQLPAHTSGLESLGWAQNRFEQCVALHHLCRFDDQSPLPTRVLDLDLTQVAFDHIIVRLLEIQNRQGQYACLSHCWGDPGSSMRLQTTRSTLENHKNGISLSKFPKTFRDAIYFVRKLGIRYLWIDSLCIVQDDPDDWRFEASRMCSVYQNSYITLAATSASNASCGLFTAVSPDYRGYKVDTIGGRDIYVRRTPPHAALSQFVVQRDNVNFPLLNRAWVYQERMLSPRFLHFGPYELVWECLSELYCPCGDNPSNGVGRSIRPKVLHMDSLRNLGADSLDMRWRSILMEYSRLALSFPGDRFPALSGLAKQWMTKKKCDYVAGLWRSSLIGDLQWKVEAGKWNTRLKDWRAPSWSWASVDSEIAYWRPPLLRLNDAGTVHNVSCVSKASKDVGDSTGELESGSLIISGLLVDGAVDFYGWNNEELMVGAEKLRNFLPDYRLGPEHSAGYFEIVYLLRIGEVNTPCSDNDDDPLYNEHTFSLVLRCLDPCSQTYERIGTYRHWRQHREAPQNRTFFGQSQEKKITIK